MSSADTPRRAKAFREGLECEEDVNGATVWARGLTELAVLASFIAIWQHQRAADVLVCDTIRQSATNTWRKCFDHHCSLSDPVWSIAYSLSYSVS